MCPKEIIFIVYLPSARGCWRWCWSGGHSPRTTTLEEKNKTKHILRSFHIETLIPLIWEGSKRPPERFGFASQFLLWNYFRLTEILRTVQQPHTFHSDSPVFSIFPFALSPSHLLTSYIYFPSRPTMSSLQASSPFTSILCAWIFTLDILLHNNSSVTKSGNLIWYTVTQCLWELLITRETSEGQDYPRGSRWHFLVLLCLPGDSHTLAMN